MSDDVVRGWATVYPHLRYRDPITAIDWLCRAFGFRERVRMSMPDGEFITSKLEGPDGGLVMIAGITPGLEDWLRERLDEYRVQAEQSWPDLSHVTTVQVKDVDAHYARAQSAGAAILMPPADQPWGLRAYSAVDLEGHQWEFSQVLDLVEPEAWGATRLE